MNVLSTFNGMGCIWYALDRAGIPVNKRYSSEIDKYANQANDAVYNDTIQLSDVTKWREWNIDWSTIDLFVGGSPCQGFSFAGKQLNFSDERSKLFFVFIEIWNHIKKHNPDAKFLLENVNMKKEYLRVISEYMGVFPVRINSNLVSAQNRDRWYWTNIKTKETGLFAELWTDIPQPENKGILLKDILQPESEVDEKYYLSDKLIHTLINHANKRKQEFQTNSPNGKAKCITVSHQKQNLDSNYVLKGIDTNGKAPTQRSSTGRCLDDKHNYQIIQLAHGFNKGGEFKDKSPTLLSNSWEHNNHVSDGYKLRRLTPRECGKLQTFTDSELDVLLSSGISDTQLYKMFGNGWTVDVIAHILSFI